MITPNGYIALRREITRCNLMFKKLKELENEWDVLSKNNCFYKSFWKIDKKIVILYKKLQKMNFSSYAIRCQDELKGYIEHLELQVEEYEKDTKEKTK